MVITIVFVMVIGTDTVVGDGVASVLRISLVVV